MDTHETAGVEPVVGLHCASAYPVAEAKLQYDLGFDADPGFDSVHFDQTPAYDLTEPKPVPDFDFDQSAGA